MTPEQIGDRILEFLAEAYPDRLRDGRTVVALRKRIRALQGLLAGVPESTFARQKADEAAGWLAGRGNAPATVEELAEAIGCTPRWARRLIENNPERFREAAPRPKPPGVRGRHKKRYALATNDEGE